VHESAFPFVNNVTDRGHIYACFFHVPGYLSPVVGAMVYHLHDNDSSLICYSKFTDE
jgi:hypothetical protein